MCEGDRCIVDIGVSFRIHAYRLGRNGYVGVLQRRISVLFGFGFECNDVIILLQGVLGISASYVELQGVPAFVESQFRWDGVLQIFGRDGRIEFRRIFPDDIEDIVVRFRFSCSVKGDVETVGVVGPVGPIRRSHSECGRVYVGETVET